MSLLQLLELAFVQGLTEFLPVSSSGHLILFSKFSHFPDQGISIDIALHIGSLLAVLIYFRKLIGDMLCGLFSHHLLPYFSDQRNKLAYLLFVSSLPALTIGFLLRHQGMEVFRDTKIIGWTILIYGVLLYIADRNAKKKRTMSDLTLKDSVWIGLAQCLALVPGTSRSGITITMARFLGVERAEAAKYSMLLSVPTILAAGLLEGYRLYEKHDISGLFDAADAVVYSFLFSYFVIFMMLKWLQKCTYLPFVIYRVILGLVLIFYSYL